MYLRNYAMIFVNLCHVVFIGYFLYCVIMDNNVLFCQCQNSKQQLNISCWQNMHNEPNILFTSDSCQLSQAISFHQHSPIKSLHSIKKIQELNNEFFNLFGQQFCEDQNQGMPCFNMNRKNDSSRKRNLGEKVKSKLQSTNYNSSQIGLKLSLNQPSQFVTQFEHSDNQQQKLYESLTGQNRHSNSKQQYPQIRNKGSCQISNKESKKQKSLRQKEERSSTESYNSSAFTFNNISAKTYQSPMKSIEEFNHENSPIQNLRDFSQLQTPISGIKQMNLVQQINPFDLQTDFEPVIRLKRVEQNTNIVDIPMANSRVIENEYSGQYKKIQSICYPCQNQQIMMPAYEYAMRQLSQLKNNVDQLQISANNLIVAKFMTVQTSIIIPSPISKQETNNKAEQSFLYQLHDNLREVLELNERQSLLLDSGTAHNSSHERGLCIYLTPNSNQQQQGQCQNILNVLAENNGNQGAKAQDNKFGAALNSRQIKTELFKQNIQNN